ncbi:hypothetical protein A7K91_17720 [Paenibacillus oryzae]|uniref:Nucleotidyltransferase-like domain-containing protein n=1 Tax=Paenibacillus oryzae TaxID=1844972 RepID=A0A1A5YVX4_9BACL|nr:nucleotidyltransferase-like protein [Paenibacillus oryzae]OBR69540.1 hypothetical protein A7K91_17720 [Paenibacillus oryzae]
MEQIKAHFIHACRDKAGLVALILIANPHPYNSLLEGLDCLVLLITEEGDQPDWTEHMQLNGKRVLIRTIHTDELPEWIAEGENRNNLELLKRGEILLDRGGYLAGVRERLIAFPESMREQRRFTEFLGFLKTYLQAKQDLAMGNVLDSFSQIFTALHHWARIVLIEDGRLPEVAVWKQIKRVHPGVYKLYEELTASPETLEQRVQLVMLACEFSVMSKMKACCTLLLDIMNSREEPWSIGELQAHPVISGLQVDLTLVLQKLLKRNYIKEVIIMKEPSDNEALELRYRIEDL